MPDSLAVAALALGHHVATHAHHGTYQTIHAFQEGPAGQGMFLVVLILVVFVGLPVLFRSRRGNGN